MCLITFQWQPEAEQRLILTANRDEFFKRPTRPLQPWKNQPGVFAGQDLSQGGSWLGVHQNGRFAALTNHRDLTIKAPEPANSRGHLVVDFLTSQQAPLEYLKQLEAKAYNFDGYNLIVADTQHLAYYSNRSGKPPRLLKPGLYGLSNAFLDTPWPKLNSAKHTLATWLQTPKHQQPCLAGLLSSTKIAKDDELPETGIGLVMERMLSCEKIITPHYGTRCSTGLIMGTTEIKIEEVTWQEDGQEASRNKFIL